MSPREDRAGEEVGVAGRSGSARYGDGRLLVNIAAALLPLLALCLWLGAAPAAAAPVRILAFGDSLTAGFGLPPEQAFPVQLQSRLKARGIDAAIANGGVSGDTTAGGLARLDWSLAEHPDIVLVELGANDALRGIDPAVTRANLDRILTRLEASGAKVLLLGMQAPPNWGHDYQRDFDAIYPALAERHKLALYPFFLDGVAMDPALNQPDGLHPNAQGVGIIVDRLAPWIERLIAGKSASG
jgi:acyl-CoA thioesterase I